MKNSITTTIIVALLQTACNSQSNDNNKINNTNQKMENKISDTTKIIKTDEEWKKQLTEEQFEVTRKKGTERPFTGAFWNTFDTGTYYCVACSNPLFVSDTKFDAGCGWPSFYEPVSQNSVEYHEDNSYGMVRKEVVCGRCGAHLGHVFNDGPPPTGLRFCMNSVSLRFEKKNN